MLKTYGRAAVGAVFLASAAAQYGQCDAEAQCTFQTNYQGSTVTFDFRRLCRPQADYVLEDKQYGHMYYAQICGKAAKSCLPQDWENQYQFGNTIQTWGTPPPCLNVSEATCVDSRTGLPSCCSEPCQVVAVETQANPPIFAPIVAGDPSQGVRLTYMGETPTRSDPYSCDYDPATGAPFPRITHMEFYCDADTTGFANFYEVAQNATDGCDYTLRFKTSAACIGSAAGRLSGGWVFNIIVFVSAALYLSIGAFVTWKKEGVIAVPNRHFWTEFDGLVLDGLRFLCNRCKKVPRGAKQLGASDESPFAGAAASSTTSAAAASTSAAAAASSYQTIGGSAAAAPREGAYNDL